MRIKLSELRQLIWESYVFELNEAIIPGEIDKKSVEIIYYPPGRTRTEMGTVNKTNYFVAVDRAGNQVGGGESEDEVLRSVRGKYFYVKRKKGQAIARNPAQPTPSGTPTEYVDIKRGTVVGETDGRGNWVG